MKIKIFTLGCKVNQYEAQGLEEMFLSLGCEITKKKADIYVINTCTVTSRADSKSRDTILRAKKENSHAKLVVCGCLEEENSNFFKKLGVDYIIPQNKKHILPEIVLGLSSGINNALEYEDIWNLKIKKFYNHRAFIKVQDGCNNFCSFCKIPYVRGRSNSRGIEDVLEEVQRISLFHQEIILCGTNLSMYGKDIDPPITLAHLVDKVLAIPSLGRLRLSSLEPYFVDDKLISFINNQKFCAHFHFPFQYGDDEILKAMNKKERVFLYDNLVLKSRDADPDIAISCDIMVGFPGEEDNHFRNLVGFLNRVKPMRMHIFTFSPREKTRFHDMKIINQKEVRKRYNILKDLADKFSIEYKNEFLGKKVFMVSEEKNKGFVGGYTENYIKVYVKESIPLGEIIPVIIDKIEDGKVLAIPIK